MSVRQATAADVDAMVALSEVKRRQYEKIQPVFWRRAEDADKKQRAYFHHLLGLDGNLMLVHETDGEVDGCMVGYLMPAPPVYDPGGLTLKVDDFVVSDWATVGTAMLEAARRLAKERGATQIVVVCGYEDAPKQEFCRGAALEIVSDWYLGPV